MAEVMDEIKQNPKLLNEYEETFTNEEKVSNALNIDKGSFSIGYTEVALKDLSFTNPIKVSRKDTYLGLTKSVEEMGILTPIHVMVTEGYADWLDSGAEGEFEGFKYTVIDGFRRIYAGLKNNIKRCMAVVWEFEDKDMGSQMTTILSRVLNKNQQHSWNETWYLHKILEMQTSMTPGTLEYLLGLEPGESMKLKDIMMCDYPEVIEELTSNKKTLTQCYNMLQKLRKEEDLLMKDDTKGLSDVDNASEMVEGVKESNESDDNIGKGTLSDQEVREILEMEDQFDSDLSEEEFDEFAGNNIPEERDKVGERHPLDPAKRAAVLTRDGYCCQVSGLGKGLPTEIALSILNVHHKVPVSDGGTNELDNLITVSLDVHTLIHIIQKRGGKLGMRKEEFDALPESTQEYLKGVMSIARIAVEADRRCGKTREQVKKENAHVSKFRMPGTDLKENMDAVMSNGGVKRGEAE